MGEWAVVFVCVCVCVCVSAWVQSGGGGLLVGDAGGWFTEGAEWGKRQDENVTMSPGISTPPQQINSQRDDDDDNDDDDDDGDAYTHVCVV